MIVKRRRDESHTKSRIASVRDMLLYVTKAEDPDRSEKIAHVGSLNLFAGSEQGQRAEMMALVHASAGRHNPVTHFILSWQEGEMPTGPKFDEAARLFATEISLEAHQVIYAAHRDTGNLHLHLAVNRVSPATEKVIKINGGFDLEAGHRAIARIEYVQGWLQEDRTRYYVDQAGEIRRSPDFDFDPGRQSDITCRASDSEHYTGLPSAQRLIRERAIPLIRSARDWREMHLSLAQVDMRYMRSAKGAAFEVAGIGVPAFKVDRKATLRELERRFGPYQEGSLDDRESQTGAVPAVPVQEGLQRGYATARHQFYATKQAQVRDLRKRRDARRKALAEAHRRQREKLLRGNWDNRGELLSALRSAIAGEQAAERAELKEHYATEFRALNKSFPSYEEWLKREGYREEADAYRYRYRARGTIRGATQSPKGNALQEIRNFTPESVGRDIRYRSNQDRRVAFVDKGPQIRVHAENSVAVLAALQLAQQKYESVTIEGAGDFMQQVASLVAMHELKLNGSEAQKRLAAERQRPKSGDWTAFPREEQFMTTDAAKQNLGSTLEPVRKRSGGKDFGL